MTLLLLAFLGGVLTILSPCILPVLPFVFARSGRPFLRSGLPLLVGMAATFALVATLAALGGGWAVQANRYGRYVALVVLALFGLTLLIPALAERLTRPLVAAGARLSAAADAGQRDAIWPSLALGVATGLLWSPCAGPILGLLLTGAALNGASAMTSLLLLAYGLGAAASLAAALLLGGRVAAAMKRSLGAGEWVRRGLGALVLVGVVAIASGFDTGVLTRVSLASTAGFEQRFIERLHPQSSPPSQQAAGKTDDTLLAPDDAGAAMAMTAKPQPGGKPEALSAEGQLPALTGATAWLNSPPLTAEGLRGKVVLIDFWTYSCINCLRALPYVRSWAAKYRDQGLVVIGVHAPEFAFEKDEGNVRRAVKDLKVDYPVALDNDYAIWRAFDNRYWPAHYFIDAEGRIRHHHFGEGGYAESEAVIRSLLQEAGHKLDGTTAETMDKATAEAGGVGAAALNAGVQSPETYVGYGRAENFDGSNSLVHDRSIDYLRPAELDLNHWALAGRWTVGEERAALDSTPGRIVFRFHARDLHLVLGPGKNGKPARFRVTLDGKPPGAAHGMDIDADGNGTVREQRLYQLIRQPARDAAELRDASFEIEFLDPGVAAYAFTFG